MKIYEVIDDLLSHNINREQAIENLINMFKYIRNNAIKFEVKSTGHVDSNEEWLLELRTKYNFKALEEIQEGDNVELYVLPY